MGKRSGEGNEMMENKSRDQKSECSSNNLVMSMFSLIDHKFFSQADI